MQRHGFKLGKSGSGPFERVLRRLWPLVTNGKDAPEDLGHYIDWTVDDFVTEMPGSRLPAALRHCAWSCGHALPVCVTRPFLLVFKT